MSQVFPFLLWQLSRVLFRKIIPFSHVKLLGEYPVNPEVDGFIKRLFDYAEFERYEQTDILRYQSQNIDNP